MKKSDVAINNLVQGNDVNNSANFIRNRIAELETALINLHNAVYGFRKDGNSDFGWLTDADDEARKVILE